MLGRGDPVGVDRLHVARIGLAAPADQEALGDRGRPVHLGLRNRRAAHAARGLRHERERHHGYAGEVVAGLLVGDVDQLPEAPLRAEHRERGLKVHARVAGAHRERVRLGRRQPGLVLAVDQQPPDLLVRDVADELLDVDPAVAKRAALAVGLGDRRVERDYSLKSRRNLDQRHCAG